MDEIKLAAAAAALPIVALAAALLRRARRAPRLAPPPPPTRYVDRQVAHRLDQLLVKPGVGHLPERVLFQLAAMPRKARKARLAELRKLDKQTRRVLKRQHASTVAGPE